MVNIDGKYKIKRDSYCWHLVEIKEGVNPKTGEPTETTKTTYHPSLEKLCRHMIDVECGSKETINEMMILLRLAPKDIARAIECA